jgi:hypothetical protein
MALEITVLAIAFAATVFGIWSASSRNNKTALIATLIAVAGFTAAVVLNMRKSSDAKQQSTAAEQKRQDEVRKSLAGVSLSNLEIIWSFPEAPEPIRKIIPVSNLVAESNLLSDDERDRMPYEIKSMASAAWHLESGIIPLLTCVVDGREDLDKLYEGENFDEAIKRRDTDNKKWMEGIGTNITYTGPTYELLFPLNVKLDAVLSLGKREDDVLSSTPAGWQEDDPSLFALTNYAFKAKAELNGKGFQIRWAYGPDSLSRAVVRPPKVSVTAGLPRRFSFVVVHRKVQRYEYEKVATAFVRPEEVKINARQKFSWPDRSVLQVVVNGLEENKYTYDVSRAGNFDVQTDRGAYDAPTPDYSYTRFDCLLRSID